jgi:MYXO-CTERM domain-containing protein
MRRLPGNRILSLALFAVAMGYMEAVIVVYIRHIGGMVPGPAAGDYHQVLARLPAWLLRTEATREAATLLMLLGVALAAGRRRREQFCIFLLTFGLWDIVYYVGLKALLNWPPSLTTTDVLFLIPRPWFAPVWEPVAASAVMIVLALGLWPGMRRRSRAGRSQGASS